MPFRPSRRYASQAETTLRPVLPTRNGHHASEREIRDVRIACEEGGNARNAPERYGANDFWEIARISASIEDSEPRCLKHQCYLITFRVLRYC